MSRFDLNKFNAGVPGAPGPAPTPPAAKVSWDGYPLQEGIDQWRYVRRTELAQFATPFVIAQLREGEPAGGAPESWRGDEAEDARGRDRRIVDRAVSIARMLQDAVDRARPRS